MIAAWFAYGGLGLLGVGCTPRTTPTAPPAGVRTVWVAPTENVTGDELAISGDGLLQELLGEPRLTVGDYMVAKAAAVLDAHGYLVATEVGLLPALRFVIENWKSDAPSLDFVVVTVSVRLDGEADDEPLWEERRVKWVVPTRGASSVAGARRLAADAIVEELLSGWRRAEASTRVEAEP